MRLIDLHIEGFGKFHDLDLRFAEGMNILYGHNEAGKSTGAPRSCIRSTGRGMRRSASAGRCASRMRGESTVSSVISMQTTSAQMAQPRRQRAAQG